MTQAPNPPKPRKKGAYLRAIQRHQTLFLYRKQKLKGRPPKNWLVRFRKLVMLGVVPGYDHLRKPYTGGMLDHLLPLSDFELDHNEWVRSQTLSKQNPRIAGAASGKARRDKRTTECAQVIKAYRAAHLGDPGTPLSRGVARWWLNSQGIALSKNAIDRLAVQLRRSGLAR